MMVAIAGGMEEDKLALCNIRHARSQIIHLLLQPVDGVCEGFKRGHRDGGGRWHGGGGYQAMEVCVMAVAWLGATPDIGLLLGWEFAVHRVAAAEAYAVARSKALNTKCYGCWDCEGGR